MDINIEIKEIQGYLNTLTLKLDVSFDKDFLATDYVAIEKAITKAINCGYCTGAIGQVYKISNDLIGCNTNLFVTSDLITLMEEEKLYNLDPFGNKLLDVRRYYIDYFLPKLIKQAITEIKPNLNINII